MEQRKDPAEAFARQWKENCEKMEQLGIAAAGTLRLMERKGALDAAKMILSGRRCSDGFEALASRGRLELSLEALAVSKPFGGLFSDAQANQALDRLCQAGYDFGCGIKE